GYSAKNIYSRQNLGVPTPENRISLRWTVRKMETTNNPPPHISKDLSGNWIALAGTFVRWNFQIAINQIVTDVADFYLPAEKAEFISATDPLALVPQHYGSATQILSSQKSALRISDARASDGTAWYPLSDWTMTNCLGEGVANLDQHYGWRSDGKS